MPDSSMPTLVDPPEVMSNHSAVSTNHKGVSYGGSLSAPPHVFMAGRTSGLTDMSPVTATLPSSVGGTQSLLPWAAASFGPTHAGPVSTPPIQVGSTQYESFSLGLNKSLQPEGAPLVQHTFSASATQEVGAARKLSWKRRARAWKGVRRMISLE
ncbi:hypothetical protein SLA2020_377390 [Shorea laevis]